MGVKLIKKAAMENHIAQELLRANKVTIDFLETRTYEEIAAFLGMVSTLKHINENEGQE
jgi:hypothetical protein